MIGRVVTRMKINRIAERTLIFIILTLASVLKSVICVSTNKFSTIENSVKCGGEYSGYQYTIGSPNYPENYPTNRDCVYILRGSRLANCDQVFHLQFLDFTLPVSENCDDDYLEIGDRNLYCGNVVGIRRFPSKNNSLTLRFHSGTGKGRKGFKILVTTSPCFYSKIGDLNDTSPTERSARHKIITKNVINEKVGNPESIDLQTQSSYPVDRPEPDLTVEDLLSPTVKPDRKYQEPLKIESLTNDKKINTGETSSPLSSFELPVRQSQLFRDPTNVSIVTPTPGKLQSISPKISAYLFVPPDQKTDSVTRVLLRNDVDHFISPPPSELILPSKWTGVFRQSGSSNDATKFRLIEDGRRVNHKFTAPVSSYGVPNYSPAKVSEIEIKPGEVFESPNNDCPEKVNLEPNLEVTANFRANNPILIDNTGSGSAAGFQGNYYPATTYGAPGLSYPGDVPSVNIGFTPSPNYGPPIVNEPGRPNDWLPGSNFRPFPTNSIGNRYPNYIPSPGIGISYPGTGFGYSQCCRTDYSAQRFLLASPGFPSLLYSGNAYECIYSVRPSSSNICQIRFNLNFFNHGTEDSFCTNGYIEIDGQRICGCKRGATIVSPVLTSFPKTIGVRYTGYPRTKFNGFLIEVIQEPCSNSYPYLSRRKKEIGISTNETIGFNVKEKSGVSNSSYQRTKRNLGYSYPKPNFGLNEEPVSTHPWSSGNGINTGIHQVLGQSGIGGNLFGPISTCQALSFFDWVSAAKDVYLRGARCVRNGSNGVPTYPGGSGIIDPVNPGSGGNGIINPGYPGSGGTGIINPAYPGSGGTGIINPGYPGSGGSGIINPSYPGNGGSGIINPGYPGSGSSGTINPGYPGSGGSGIINPSYPGNGGSGIINPGYPGIGGSGIINPSYPGNGGSGILNPGYPGNGGSGTINPGYPGSGVWNGPSSKCEDVNVIEGIISSPQYPTNYPNNVNKCFRFYKAPESCQLEIVFLDFDLENSGGCSKDYVMISGQNRRYCGRSLAGSKSLNDISRINIVEIYFVSDGYGSGRGFSAGFSQIPCRGLINR